MPTISVNGAAPYECIIGADLLPQVVAFVQQLPSIENVGIIHQEPLSRVASALKEQLLGCGLSAISMQIPDAEEGKTLTVAGACWDTLGSAGFGRKDLIIGLGGGAATDLAGFVAAGWMRGIKHICLPTTLLAMVDAAVGGKTGINTIHGKNTVGAFHEPAAVFIDTEFLRSLPQDELIAGSAEIIKTGFIGDPVILERYQADPAACLDVDGFLPELIARSVAVKADVVAQDLQESSLREILNYGHTFGHAIELNENYTWRHGDAVAVGMMFVANLAYHRGLISQELLDLHRSILESVNLPVNYCCATFEALYEGMRHDKKNRDGKIRFVVITEPGKCSRLEDATIAELERAFEAILSDQPLHRGRGGRMHATDVPAFWNI